MNITIRWKLMASYLFLILAIVGVLYGYLNHTLTKHLVSDITEGLLSEARVARLAAVKEMADIRRDAPAAATDIAPATRARVTIIDREGNVLGDSEVDSGELSRLENHRDRPEVREALEKGEGTAIRYSATLRTSLLYVALPFTSAHGEKAILRLPFPSSVEETEASIRTILFAALLVATVIALMLSSVLTHVASRSLRAMAATAAKIGSGEFGRRIPVTGGDELGDLARVMNEMAQRIESHVESVVVEKNRLDTILRGMGEGLLVVNGKGVITLVNPAFRALFSVSDQVEGKRLIDTTRHPALHDAFKMVVETKNEQLQEMTLNLPDEKAVLTHWVPLLDGEDIQGVVAVFHDISDLKQLERVRKDFVANVSHELRTPVTVIKGYAETLLSDPQNADPLQTVRFIEKIYAHSERLASLITDLLTLSELETSGAALQLAPLRLEGAALKAAALLEQKARDKKIILDTTSLATAPAVLADRGRLEQVLINLLDNAVKFTPAGGTVILSTTEAGDMVNLAITDTGIGIPAKELPRVFERFYRVDSARSRTEGGSGTGLGLAIVKHIVQLHGGTIDVQSTPGSGSTFFFSLQKAPTLFSASSGDNN